MVSKKRRAFIEEYLRCFNATEAAKRAGYSEKTAYSQGARLLKNVEISQEIQRRLDEKAMQANEVLQRLSDMARGDLGDFLDINSMSFDLALQKAKELGLTHLIKKVKQRTVMRQKKDGDEEEEHWLDIELHDSQSALEKIARIHSMFNDKLDLTSGGEKIRVTILGND